MTILVTGAAGFIGMAVADRLLAAGRAVIGIDNMNDYYPVSLKRDRVAALHERHGKLFTFAELDFADMDALNAALSGQTVEAIVHLGAQAGVRYSLWRAMSTCSNWRGSGGCGIWSMPPPHPSMAATMCCRSGSRIAQIIPFRSTPPQSVRTS
jgi:GDP-D-mannose dehydratase